MVNLPADLFNYRDLGGPPVPGGRLRTGLLFRSNAVVGLEAEASAGLGLRTAIDLREPGEKHAEPATAGSAQLHEVEIIDADPGAPHHLEPFTHWLVESRGHALVEVIRLLAHEPLPAVFFCSSGKDRTGMLAGLLQSALGVSDADVVAGYAETERLMPESYFELALVRSRRAGLPENTAAVGLGSPPELMAQVLAGVRERHGGAAAYLSDHGLAAADLDRLRSRLVV
ncbi:MAG: protein-tyrosine phosphatase [Nocardioidaceae bacterium]|jgi:protein-tyrosine phosphatase|nr:protein-tyrosine phosphatase [Nocardioidaceae bacterium]